MAEYQVQFHDELEDGTDIPLMPVNRALDVKVGKLSAGSLTLPGNAADEILAQTLANIRKYLDQLSTVASAKRGVSSSTTSTSTTDLATSKAVNDLKVRIDGNDETLSTHATQIAGKAPTSHASTALTYGGATGANYGHVKLSDTYSTAVENGSAQYSIGASQAAVYNAYNALNGAKAPKSHAVNNSTYGLGTASLYGHVKLSDTYASKVANAAAANAIAASQNALYNAYAALKKVNDSQETAIGGKAPTSHASTDATTYGAATETNYGHVKLYDGYDTDNSATGAAANSVAASSWAVYRAYSSLAVSVGTKLASTHASEKATASKFSHVKLSDNYTSSAGAASAGIGASSLAVYNSYAALLAKITSAESSITTLNSRCDSLNSGKANASHTHAWSAITGKPSSYTPSGHTHDDRYYTEAEINNTVASLQSSINGKANSSHSHDWNSITSKPSSFNPSSHSHTSIQNTGGDCNVDASSNSIIYANGGVFLRGNNGTVVQNKGGGYTTIAASAFNVASSKLVKENIVEMEAFEALKILKLNVVSFDYRSWYGGKKGNFGLLAEDVLDHGLRYPVTIPDGYSEQDVDVSKGTNNKILTVDYSKFVPYLIKLVQIQQSEIEKIKKEE